MPVALALALCVAAADGGVAPGEAGAPRLDGTWVLDLERSSALAPLLERLDVGWFVKQGAKSARPTHVITTEEGRATIEVRSPLSTRHSTLVLDGATALEDELFGNAISLTSSREGGTIVSRGHVTHHGKKLPLETRRSVHEDGSMRYLIRLSPPGETPITLERVFSRKN